MGQLPHWRGEAVEHRVDTNLPVAQVMQFVQPMSTVVEHRLVLYMLVGQDVVQGVQMEAPDTLAKFVPFVHEEHADELAVDANVPVLQEVQLTPLEENFPVSQPLHVWVVILSAA
jgi:hypothetical protein